MNMSYKWLNLKKYYYLAKDFVGSTDKYIKEEVKSMVNVNRYNQLKNYYEHKIELYSSNIKRAIQDLKSKCVINPQEFKALIQEQTDLHKYKEHLRNLKLKPKNHVEDLPQRLKQIEAIILQLRKKRNK